jgi:hypothetical protein
MAAFHSMRTLTFVLLMAVLPASSGHLPTTRNPELEELSRLNECIQARFLSRTSFGMSRIAVPAMQYHGMRMFHPENATEQAVVNQIQKKGYELAVFLAGRVSSTPLPSRVQGPALVTNLRDAKQLPGSEDLLPESRAALASFQTGDGYDIRMGDWTVAMRPLRASNEGCIACHTARTAETGIHIGDALGVLMYVFRPIKPN